MRAQSRPLLLVLALAVAPLPAQLVCGDCNGDLQVSILDALVAAQHGAGLLALVTPQYELCNVTGVLGPTPGVVDVLDALTLAQFAAGLIAVLPCDFPPGCVLTGPAPGMFSADVPLDFDTSDPLGQPLDLLAEYSIDAGVTWSACGAAAGSSLPNPATATLPGAGQQILWDAVGDVPMSMRPQVAELRLTVGDGALTGQCTLGPIDLVAPQNSWLLVCEGFSGLRVAAIDPLTGAPGMFATVVLPGANRSFFGAATSTGDRVYISDLDAGIHMLAFDKMTGVCTPLPGSPLSAGGFASRHIGVDASDTHVYLARSTEVRGYDIQPAGTLVPIAGGPWPTGTNPGGMALSPAGDRLYVASWSTNNLSGFDIAPGSGALTAIAGSPWPGGNPAGACNGLGFIGNDRLYVLATPSALGAASTSGFDVGPSGALTPMAVGPWPTGGSAAGSFSPSPLATSGDLVFAGHSGGSGVSSYVVQPSGDLLLSPGSPVSTTGGPYAISVHPISGRLYVSCSNPGGVEAFDVDPLSGALTRLPGSPFPATTAPRGLFIVLQ